MTKIYPIQSGETNIGVSLGGGDYMYVRSGGTAISTTVNSGGYMYVSSGGSANNTTVNFGGRLTISRGGTATNVLWTPSNGAINVEDGAYVTYASSYNGVYLGTSHALTMENKNIWDASMYVMNSGIANSTTVNTYSILHVSSGGTANITTVNSRGWLYVSSGGTANSTTVNFGGSLYVSSGGTATNTTVKSGGYMYVSRGGAASIMALGGSLVVDGNVSIVFNPFNPWSGNNISTNGNAEVIYLERDANIYYGNADKGVISKYNTIVDFSIESGNSVFVYSGGLVNNTTVNGGKLCNIGGTINSITVSSGYLSIDSRGTANKTTVSSGGYVYLRSNGVAHSVSVTSLGTFTIDSGGLANEVSLFRYGILSAGSAAQINGLEIQSRGSASISGALLRNANLHSSARLSGFQDTVVSGGMVGSDAQMYLGSGAVASDISVSRMGTLFIDNGGIAYNTMLDNDGRMIILGEADGIAAAGASICLGDSSFAVYDEAGWPTSNSYEEDIHASNTKLNSSWMLVYYGASATETDVSSNSWLHVYYGGSARNTEITSSGYLTLHQSGTADTVNLHSGGYLRLYTGSIVKGSINVGGEVTVWQAGTSATEDVIRAYGANINFALNERKSSDSAIISNLGMIMGATYFVTVSGNLQSGTYKLADGAADFTGSITVRTVGGTTLGSVNVGQSLSYGDYTYSLIKNNDQLSLTAAGNLVVEEKSSPGDLNADGRADIVMTIDQSGHPADGATGAWLILEDQTAAWGDLSTRNSGWVIFGTGKTAAGKNTDDVYIRSEGNIVGAWTTGDDGKVNGWETIGEFNSETQVLGLGDFNGNGQSDLLLRATNGAVGCFFTNGQGWNYFQSLGDEWKLCAIGDFNGDGRDDVVLKHDAGFAGSWLTQEDGTPMWADLDTLPDGFEIVGAGDFDGDGTDDVLLKNGGYYGAWLVQNGNAVGWFGLGDLGDAAVEQIADFSGDGVDDLRIRTAAGDLGAQLVMGADTLDWHYYGSVGEEWSTSLAALA